MTQPVSLRDYNYYANAKEIYIIAVTMSLFSLLSPNFLLFYFLSSLSLPFICLSVVLKHRVQAQHK